MVLVDLILGQQPQLIPLTHLILGQQPQLIPLTDLISIILKHR
jgi:hypothetical protein